METPGSYPDDSGVRLHGNRTASDDASLLLEAESQKKHFNARHASAQCALIPGYVSFADVEGLGMPASSRASLIDDEDEDEERRKREGKGWWFWGGK